MSIPRYFDYMASTPIADEVIVSMQECMMNQQQFGNPASISHDFGRNAQHVIDQAAQQVAKAIGSDAEAIVWTSGATEANNLAIKGAAEFYQRKGKHIITLASEHKSVLDTCATLESQGYEVTYLNPQANGLLDLIVLEKALRRDTLLVSVAHVNNETGVVQDIAAIAAIVKASGALLHVDGAQSLGKVAVDVKATAVDLMTFSAHKAYGPIGIGALYVRQQPRIRLSAQTHGGGHQRGLRSGTLPTHQIVGMGKAFEWVTKDLHAEQQRVANLRQRLWHGLQCLGGVTLNGDLQHQVPHCLNVCFAGVDGEALLTATRQLALAMGSACNSALNEPSHVLLSMGRTKEQALRSLRISFGRQTSKDDIDFALEQFSVSLKRLRQLSPL